MEVVNVIEAKEMLEKNLGKENFEFIDVRSPLEHREAHIEGCRLIPLEEIEAYLDSFDKKKKYLIYCRSGGRSGMACQIMEARGFKTVNMQGGILDWAEEGFELVR
ncbi:MAG: rhodanese-like domain-containing protein [Nanoarchaeota archaeon]|nr:rhodanese-like domain-containing protein [Nanoarchaeota archaeon]